jgi:hypothetical protein
MLIKFVRQNHISAIRFASAVSGRRRPKAAEVLSPLWSAETKCLAKSGSDFVALKRVWRLEI